MTSITPPHKPIGVRTAADELFQAGWCLFQRYADKRYSLTDCLSFAVMRHIGLTTALTFDRHFAQAGFTCKP